MKIRYLLLLFALTLPALAQQNALTVQHDYSAAGSAAWLPIAGYTSHTLTWSQVGSTTVTGCAVQVDGNSVNSGSGSAGGVVPSQSATTNGTITTTATSFSYARVTVTGCTAGTIRVTYSAVNAALSKGGGGSISGTSPIVVSGGVVSCPTCGTSLATVQSVAASGVNWPAWLTPSVTNPTTTPSLFVAATTGQTSHQVIGTCGTATAFAPCALVAGDIPAAIPIANIGSAGLSGTLPVSINSAGAISVANTNATYFPFQSLTTTGTSGASTVSGGVLNIPQYSGGPTLGTAAQVPVMNSGATAYAPQTITQDASVTAAGAWTNTGLKGVPFCTGFTPTNGQALQYTTGGSPNPCYGAVTITGGGNVSNTGTPVSQQVAEWTSATVVKGTTGFTDSGTQLTYTGQFQTDLLGAGNQAACQVTASGTYTNTQACADYMEGTLGLRSGIINSRPEVISTDPFTVNFSPDWRLSTGPTNSTTCDDSGSNTNCTVAEVPLIIGASGLTIGLGPVLKGQDMSQGSLILSGPTNWKPPVGIPTEGSPTCSGSGGPAGATYYIGVQMVVNLETHSGKSPFAGPSAFVGKTVTCTTGQSTITVPAPTGGNAGSFTKTDYRIGIAANSTAAGIGDYYVQQPGVATTCGSAGTIDSTNDCLISGGSSTVAIASIQTASTSFPMAADNKTGDPVDLSNVMIVMGTRSTISFLEQFRDTAIACPSTGQGVNNPNVLIWNLNGEEGAGTNNGTVQIYGDCGGYAGIAGGFVYSESHTPNSTWSQVSMSGGPTSGAVPFFGLMCDGRPDGSGSASGCPREMNNVTIALRGGGTADVDVEEQGDRAWLGISNFHGETQSSQDNIFVTNGAHLVFNHVEGFTGGNSIHLSSTAGFSSGVGICPQGSATTYQERCSSGSIAIQDDTDTSGNQPLLGYQAHWASNGTPSYFGNVTSNAAIKTTGNGVDAGYFALGGNTANFAVTANTVGFMGPTTTTFTAWAAQLPAVGPAGTTQYLGCSGSGAATCSWNTVSGAVSSVSNSDSTLTISPTTGAVVASLNLGHAQTWSALQTFGSNASIAATAHGVLLSQNTSAVTAAAVGATNTVLNGNTGADPTFGAVPLAAHATQTADTMVANMTAGTAAPTAVAIPTTAHGVWLGEGTGTAPGITAAGATNTVLHGNTGADPTYSAVALADHATQAADTIVQNATGGTAAPTAVAMPTCTSGADLYNTSTHTWSCVAGGSGAPGGVQTPTVKTATYAGASGDFSGSSAAPGLVVFQLTAVGQSYTLITPAPAAGSCVMVENITAPYILGIVTGGATTLDGTAYTTALTSPQLGPGQKAEYCSDGTNYYTAQSSNGFFTMTASTGGRVIPYESGAVTTAVQTANTPNCTEFNLYHEQLVTNITYDYTVGVASTGAGDFGIYDLGATGHLLTHTGTQALTTVGGTIIKAPASPAITLPPGPYLACACTNSATISLEGFTFTVMNEGLTTTANSKIGGGQGSACTAGVLPATSTFTPNNNPNVMPMMAITP